MTRSYDRAEPSALWIEVKSIQVSENLTVFKDKIKIVRRILRSVWVAMLLTMEDDCLGMLREGIFPRDVSPNLRSKKDTVLPTVSGPGGKSSMNESFAPVDERGPIHTKENNRSMTNNNNFGSGATETAIPVMDF
eukprot:CAMPEP_0113466822 /NCGR_PEP_ID=MMETSP0014_2-20120614/14479_1 /TAXON_ID=2857 /ORGANISM="Nitzschia sp." /LENGTH=134 /DNA_ID=CAMNT_0000359075 /DNA_START=1171 /DNA_END=1576 /DNA_ORIENTATION=+ /assembly_acc=CAM_ASM_000159